MYCFFIFLMQLRGGEQRGGREEAHRSLSLCNPTLLSRSKACWIESSDHGQEKKGHGPTGSRRVSTGA